MCNIEFEKPTEADRATWPEDVMVEIENASIYVK